VLLPRPQAHLRELGLLPARHDVDAEPSRSDRIDGHRHARGQRGVQGQQGRGRIEPDALGHRGKAGHQREGLQVVVPELGSTAEAAELDHGQREFEPRVLCDLHYPTVVFEGRFVLRRSRRYQPAIVATRGVCPDRRARRSSDHCV
jgi:hypothetical protein